MPRLPVLPALCLLALTSVASAATRPNIVFIFADDLGYAEISAHGQRHYTTPHIDRFAAEGVRFTDHYAGSAVCAPSRNALMTGEHTGHLTVRNNFAFGGNAGDRVSLKPDDVTIAERLRAAGYVTGMVGKWGLGEVGTGAEPWNKGWDFFYGFVNQKHAHNHHPEFLYRNAQMEPIIPNYGHLRGTYANDRFTEEAEQFIERQHAENNSFFLYVAYTTPHAELACPEDALAEARAKHPELAAPGAPGSALVFAAMVLRLDRDVGRLVAKLDALGLGDNTLVIFTSDNGPHKEGGKDNAFFNAHGPLRGLKRDLYEGGIRVPFIARWPGTIAPGTTTGHVSALWDFPATALEVAGAPRGNLPTDGISYLPTLRGRASEQASHGHLYWEFVVNGVARQAIRQGDWKAVRYGVDAKTELYDLATDVGETRDLSARHPDRVLHFEDLFVTAREPDPLFPLRPPVIRSSE